MYKDKSFRTSLHKVIKNAKPCLELEFSITLDALLEALKVEISDPRTFRLRPSFKETRSRYFSLWTHASSTDQKMVRDVSRFIGPWEGTTHPGPSRSSCSLELVTET